MAFPALLQCRDMRPLSQKHLIWRQSRCIKPLQRFHRIYGVYATACLMLSRDVIFLARSLQKSRKARYGLGPKKLSLFFRNTNVARRPCIAPAVEIDVAEGGRTDIAGGLDALACIDLAIKQPDRHVATRLVKT
ncbi:MAG TPA: hypothetical protein VGM26_01580 [Rhizomicrobium sp.]